jgi:CRP/FNR family transcriptional regulator, cyclic AMP receptor protein
MYNIASEDTYQDGQTIFKEGSSGDWVYIIVSGSVEISKMVGGEKLVIEVLKEGEIFGELSFLGGIQRSATATAVGETTLGVIDREYMDQQFNNLSSDFRSILSALVKRFKSMSDTSFEASSPAAAPAQQKALSLSFKDHKTFLNAYKKSGMEGEGLFIRTEKPLQQGEKFILKLQLPGVSDPMRISCEVAEARTQGQGPDRPAGMGLRFCEMSEKDGQALKKYVDKVTG